MEHTHFVSVAGLVRNSRGQILLVNSPRRRWEYPGGMAEPGESLQDALHREILEESGVTVRVIGFFASPKISRRTPSTWIFCVNMFPVRCGLARKVRKSPGFPRRMLWRRSPFL